MIQEMENSLIPKGSIDLVGFGRLGLRTGINLIQIHRGGPSKITVIDGQKISESDIIFLLKGAEVGTYKADFLKELSTHPANFREVVSITEDISEDNLDLITGDVVVIEIAGGNTIPTASKIIKKAHENGSKTLGTAGIFGIGDEEIIVKDISEFDDSNPAVNELRKEGIVKDHLILTTSTFIRDAIPITPYVLDDIANTLTKEALKLLIEKNNE
ncbi:MAG: ThiF family adenylyltransferase [Methanobrevibacter ruminantium]|uniref:ThiF family adenylyltransferase n=1 Tax=Methanobrevibacter ruminantium TaxID=83816 RepID=UPI0026F15943|nr:ThiF family adenylyltransferase [Methanobrevibacter ruminantium]MDO5843194.1 ThiF family adenylyltransferase [Methanobrevibacter ruminantium]